MTFSIKFVLFPKDMISHATFFHFRHAVSHGDLEEIPGQRWSETAGQPLSPSGNKARLVTVEPGREIVDKGPHPS